MPTKPTDIPDIWASDTLYSIGPKSGLPNKTDTAAPIAAAPQGHIPGKDFPTTANEFNLWCFEISKVAEWVMGGSNLPDQDAHIVETRSDGEARIALLTVGGTTATGPSLQVQESALGTGPSALITGIDDPALRVQQVTTGPSNSFVQTMLVESNADKDTTPGNDYIARIISDPNTPLGGPGALELLSEGIDADTNGKFWSTLNVENQLGIAGKFSSSITGSAGTLEANNIAVEGVALFIGLRTPGKGMQGISVLAGEGDPGATPVAGGLGISTIGGAGLDGLNDVDGGDGLFARGGTAVSGTPGRGAHIQSGGVGAYALQLSNLVEPSQNVPLIYGESGVGIGGGMELVCEESGVGIISRTQSGAGIRLIKSESATFQRGVHIYMNPQVGDPTVSNSDGNLWLQQSSVGPDIIFDLRMFLDGQRYIPVFTHQVVYAHKEKSAQTSNAVNGSTVVVDTFSLSPELRPSKSGAIVIIEVKGYALMTGASVPLVQPMDFVITDDTAIPATVIDDRQFDLLDQSIRHFFSYSFEYTLPTAGGRDFSFGIRKNDKSPNDPTLVTVGGMFWQITTKWDQ